MTLRVTSVDVLTNRIGRPHVVPLDAYMKAATRKEAALLCALNMASTLVALYLFYTYGALSGWWSRLFLSDEALQSRGSTFHNVADPIYFVVLVLLSFNVVAAITLSRLFDGGLPKLAVVSSLSALCGALLIQF